MAFHISRLGSHNLHVTPFADIDGFVPTEKTKCWEMNYSHNATTHHDDGTLTDYGVWFEEDCWPVIKACAIAETERANASILK